MAIDTEQHEHLQIASALKVTSEIAQRYQLSSVQPLINSCRKLAEHDELSIALVGRFKAGKSSFLNHFFGREVLPVGVVPVTTVVTEINYGPVERAMVHFISGDTEEVLLDEVRSFIAESENPGNRKRVSTVAIELPELSQTRALRFVDMPGLESTFAHNTETALNWLPKVGLALVAVSVDPPLSQHDIALITSLYEYTPKVSILLTKVDLLNEHDQQEVIAFVEQRLKEAFDPAPEVFPYSIRPGFEHLRSELMTNLIGTLLTDFQAQRSAVLERKLETIMCESHDYLMLALRSAETIASERATMQRLVLGEKEVIDDLKSELKIIVQHKAAGMRAEIAKRLDAHRTELKRTLLSEVDSLFPNWTSSLDFTLTSYEGWLNNVLAQELAAVSAAEREHLLAPLDKLKAQVFHGLQNFRDRLSNQAMRAFGVSLGTSEQEIKLSEPHTPDIHIGHVFDRSWELLSPIVPMSIVGPLVRRHFTGSLSYMIEKNLSRLTTQWDESIRAAMADLLTEAHRRIDELVATISSLISTVPHDAPRIREDLERLNSARQTMRVL